MIKKIFLIMVLFSFAASQPVFADVASSSGQFNPALDYTGNPHYSPYYYFAKYKLFDGVDFFTSSQNTSTTTASCPLTTPSDKTSLNAQLAAWGFKVEGSAETLDLLQETFATVCLLNQSSYYVDHLSAPSKNIIISFEPRASGGGCTDYTFGACQGSVGGKDRTYNGEPVVHLFAPKANATEENRFFLTHELGHVFSSRNNNIQQSFNASVFSVAPQLSSINCSIKQAQTPEENECFADAVGLYLVYPNFTAWASDFRDINNYPTGKYKLYYDFVQTNVFGGTDFFATSSNGQSALADYAVGLVNTINTTCGKTVSKRNEECIPNITPPPTDTKNSVIQILLANIDENYTLQCVGFVQGAAIGIGRPIGNGNAKDFAKRAITGYTWVPKSSSFSFQTGDILIQQWAPSGQHIAIVTKINGDTIVVAQANGSDGSVENVPRGVNYVLGPLLGVQRPN